MTILNVLQGFLALSAGVGHIVLGITILGIVLLENIQVQGKHLVRPVLQVNLVFFITIGNATTVWMELIHQREIQAVPLAKRVRKEMGIEQALVLIVSMAHIHRRLRVWPARIVR